MEGSSQLTVTGNWTNNGTFTCGTGTVVFGGSSHSDVKSGGSSFYRVHVAKSSESYIVKPVTNNIDLAERLYVDGGTYRDNGLTTDVAGHIYVHTSDATLQVNDGGEMHLDLEAGNMYLNNNGALTVSNGWFRLDNAMQVAHSIASPCIINLSSSGVIYVDEDLYCGHGGGAGLFLNITGGTFKLGRDFEVQDTPSWTASNGTWEFVAGEGECDLVYMPSAVYFPNLTITSTTLDANSRNIKVRRNWTNNGTFTCGTGTVTFDGSSNSNITGATTFYEQEVNKTSNSYWVKPAASTTLHITNLDVSHAGTFDVSNSGLNIWTP